MTGAERVNQYLSEAKTYYLATVDNDQPRVRPFGTSLLFEGKVYIQTGLKKDVAHQIEKNPKFEIYVDKAGGFRFRLKATNGEPILASESYKSKAGCKNGIESVKKNAESETVKVQ